MPELPQSSTEVKRSIGARRLVNGHSTNEEPSPWTTTRYHTAHRYTEQTHNMPVRHQVRIRKEVSELVEKFQASLARKILFRQRAAARLQPAPCGARAERPSHMQHSVASAATDMASVQQERSGDHGAEAIPSQNTLSATQKCSALISN